MESVEDLRLDGFIGRFSEKVAAQARAAVSAMRRRLPGAMVLVYDNYNALAIGFGANDRVSGIVFSIAVYPRWVSLFFSAGTQLDDPHGLLKGQGARVRHIVLTETELLDDPRVIALMDQALVLASPAIRPGGKGEVLIKSVSAWQRPRRPA